MPGLYEIINQIYYCCEHCPHLKHYSVNAWCLLLEKELMFYDWFLAECDTEKPVED